MRRIAVPGWIAVGGLATILLMQAVPYGRNHTNPPTTGSPSWDSPRTEMLVRQTCFDCHSNESRWPWYASIAPASWRVQRHVNAGRRKLNFSRFDQPQEAAGEAAEEVGGGNMPPWDYVMMHPEARLSAGDRQDLVAGLVATFGASDSERDRMDGDEAEE